MAICSYVYSGDRVFSRQMMSFILKFRYHLYYSGGERAEHGVGFIVIGKQMKRVIRWKPINDRICVLRIKGKFFNYSLISIYVPTNEKPDDTKDAFYESLDKAYRDCPRKEVKIVIEDANAHVGREQFLYPIIGTQSLHSATNDNGLRLVTFAAARRMAINSTYFACKDIRKHTWRHAIGSTYSQIDHVLVDERHFIDVIDVRTFRGPNIDLGHYLVIAKIRARLSSVTSQRNNRTMRFNIQRFSAEGVATEYRQKLDERIDETNVTGNVQQHVGGCPRSCDYNGTRSDRYSSAAPTKRLIRLKVSQRVPNEKNASRNRMLVIGTRLNRERYGEARSAEKRTHCE
ncbi:craniofacial development protein 2-like [Topomyia yanbarensis]|uniref:craniofacial development protein 2-like n=1 Tax=Topomyia yanbarensis TaxID=2498891 RepID=UPI00273C1239|nr:craniofacial development protein 2-like [Topomyia yanbarensis]